MESSCPFARPRIFLKMCRSTLCHIILSINIEVKDCVFCNLYSSESMAIQYFIKAILSMSPAVVVVGGGVVSLGQLSFCYLFCKTSMNSSGLKERVQEGYRWSVHSRPLKTRGPSSREGWGVTINERGCQIREKTASEAGFRESVCGNRRDQKRYTHFSFHAELYYFPNFRSMYFVWKRV